MKLFNCRVQLGGDVGAHEVPKKRITEKELRLLRHIHGEDTIKALEPAGEVETTDREEYLRLAVIYRKRVVEKFFGVTLEDFDDWLSQRIADGEAENRHAETMKVLREVPAPAAMAGSGVKPAAPVAATIE